MKYNDLTLTFLKSGLNTTLQDQGRPGMQHLGIPFGGAMDKCSATLANQLVNNDPSEPLLEITMAGPEILFDADSLIAITGAKFNVYADDQLLDNHKAYFLKSGTVLRFKELTAGCRAYVAVAGKWKVKKWKESVSPLLYTPQVTPDSFIKKGSKIKIESGFLNKTGSLDKNCGLPALTHKVRLRVTAGPEFEMISRSAIAKFFGQGHKISQDSNRMGYQLTSFLRTESMKEEMISSGIIPGTIQITGKGQPIILLNDAQTTGGYPRIANIIQEDLDQVAQLKPGDEIWFCLD